MSLLKSNSVQIGQSTTGTNNFTLSVPSSPDGTIKLARGNSGATTADILSINASGVITGSTFSGATINSSTVNGGSITSGTAVASTSGTAIDFTGIPSWVKRVTVMLSDVSVSGSSQILIRLGTSSGIVSTGYVSHTALVYGTNLTATATSSSGLILFNDNNSHVRFGNCQICNLASNTWTASHSLGWQNAIGDVGSVTGGGAIGLSGVLDRVRLTTVNGTDTFDSGTVNISYEG